MVPTCAPTRRRHAACERLQSHRFSSQWRSDERIALVPSWCFALDRPALIRTRHVPSKLPTLRPGNGVNLHRSLNANGLAVYENRIRWHIEGRRVLSEKSHDPQPTDCSPSSRCEPHAAPNLSNPAQCSTSTSAEITHHSSFELADCKVRSPAFAVGNVVSALRCGKGSTDSGAMAGAVETT